MINQVDLEGRLARDVHINYTQDGKAHALFTIASDRNYTNSKGDTPADFVDCEMWGRNTQTRGQYNNKQVENLKQYTQKGSMISVQGSIQPNSYQNKQGITVYRQPVVVYRYNFLDTKGNSHQGQGGQPQQAAPSHNQKTIVDPFAPSSDKQQSGNKPSQKQNSQGSQQSAKPNNNSNSSPKNPFDNSHTDSGNKKPAPKGNKKIDISDDDLPF